MAVFTYTVREASGATTSGTVTADSRVDALNSLRNKNLFVLNLVEQEIETNVMAGGFGGGFFQRVKLDELAIFTKQLAAMVGAGIAITRCLDTLAKQQSKNTYFRNILLQIKADVSAGLPLSAAMAKYPRIFNPMMISLLISAEETGTLDTTLEDLASTLESEVALRQQISAGMRYPIIVATAALIVVSFVMIFVVPQFATIFESLNAELPIMTQIVMGIAMFMKHWWFVVVVLFIGMPWLLNLVASFPVGRQTLDLIKLRLPVFGDLTKKIILARTSKVFSTMLSAGVPIIKALSIVEQSSLNAIYEGAFSHIKAGVREGRNINGPMDNYPGLFPPMVVAMVAVGEESGTLDQMLLKVNDFYTREVETMVQKLTALLEPVLIGTLGGIIGFIVIALWMPLFRIIQIIQEMG